MRPWTSAFCNAASHWFRVATDTADATDPAGATDTEDATDNIENYCGRTLGNFDAIVMLKKWIETYAS